MSRTYHQLWRTCGSGSMIHSHQQLCMRHLRAAVLFEQQQVVHVRGFLLPVNWSLFGSSTNSQESSMIWFRLQHSHLVASWSGWCTCDPPMATGAKQSPLSCFYSIILVTERTACHKCWTFFSSGCRRGSAVTPVAAGVGFIWQTEALLRCSLSASSHHSCC